MKKSTIIRIALFAAFVVIIVFSLHVQRHPIDRVAVEDATMAGR